MIKIGVSACFMYPDPSRLFFSKKTLCYLESDMANYLFRDEVLPILIPPLNDQALQQLLAQMDGFVFQGGSDLSPLTYGEDFLNKERWPGDIVRDRYELKMIDYAFKHAKPMLGICRGAQLLNVYFGGTLYQDLETQYSHAVPHRDKEKYDALYHQIELTTGKILSTLYNKEINLHVNSIHHQGIKTLGSDLLIEAICPVDQLIEAFSYKNMQEKFVFGIQWHPEFSHTIKEKLIPAEPIYDYFLNDIRKKI